MHILVTGSSGTIGTRLCEELLAKGHTVTGIDWVENKWKPEIEKLTKHIDLRDESKFSILHCQFSTRPVDAIVHLAANARVYELVEHPDRARDNFLTLFNMLEFARKNSIKRFLFASSRESYGNIHPETNRSSTIQGLTEDLVRVENCESPYTASKIGGEALVHAYARCYDLQTVIFRFSNVYGMYDDSIRVVPLFIRQARVGEPLVVFGRDKCLDFTHIDDAVAATILALRKFDAIAGEVVNIATGTGTTIVKLAEDVKKLLQSSSEIRIGKARTGEVIRYVADIAKARKLLGYEPRVTFKEGIRRTVEWYGKNSQ